MSRFFHLFSSVAVFTIVFWLFYACFRDVTCFSLFTAKFIGSIVITLLCIYIIYGFSCLKLHRTAYLIIGILGAVIVINIAKPLIYRTQLMSQTALFCIKPVDSCVTALKFSKPLLNNLSDICVKPILTLRNDAYFKVYNSLGDRIEEPVLNIFLLCFAQLLLASGIGIWIGEGIDKISHLIPLALVAGLADIWSVFAGATSVIIVSSTIHYFFLRLPVFGMKYIPPLIGLTDYLFFAIFFQAVIRFKLPIVKNLILLALSFPVTSWLALYCGIGLPVLPFMGALFVLGNIKNLTLDKKEIKQIIAFIIVIGVIFSLISCLYIK